MFVKSPSALEGVFACVGKYVDLKDTISGFKGILDGQYDDLPEMAFYMVRFLNSFLSVLEESVYIITVLLFCPS